MKVSEPRIKPLEQDEWNETAQEIMKPMVAQGRIYNIFKTLTNHPDLMRRWMVFANHILGKSTLDPREREIAILRIGYLCEAEYEWGQHVLIGKDCGLTDDEIQMIKAGPGAEGWSEKDRLLMQATDDLHKDAHVSDATWAGLEKHYSTQQLMDIVFTVGQYNMVSMVLNSFGVQLDDFLPGFDD
ncbi:MAG: carboxymuconolactone decarboxylase family protein [Pseudomonadota bacterium]